MAEYDADQHDEEIDLHWSLTEAKDWLRERVEEGAHCPCCTQMAKVYKRRINATMAKTLITLYRYSAVGEFVHAPSLPGDTHECSQLVWWNLIEEEADHHREDGGRAGWWRVTALGRRFVDGEIALPSHARVYDGRCLALVPKKYLTIQDCLGHKFDLRELLAA